MRACAFASASQRAEPGFGAQGLFRAIVLAAVSIGWLTGCGHSVAVEPVRVERRELPAPPISPEGAFVGVVSSIEAGPSMLGPSVLMAGGLDAEGLPSDAIAWLQDGASSWQLAKNRLPVAVADGATVMLRDGIVCIGGKTPKRVARAVTRLRIVRGQVRVESWPPLPEPRVGAIAWRDGDRLVVAGGAAEVGGEAAAGAWTLAMRGLDAVATDAASDGRGERKGRAEWRSLGLDAATAMALRRRHAAVGPHPVTAGQLVVGGWRAGDWLADGFEVRADGDRLVIIGAANGVEGEPAERNRVLARAAPSSLGQYHAALPVGGDRASLVLFDGLGRRFSRRPLVAAGANARAGSPKLPATWTHWLPWAPDAGRISALVLSADPPTAEQWVVHSAQRGAAVVDALVVAGYLLLVLGLGARFWRRNRSADAFFLADRRIPWWAAGLSILATQVSAITFVAIPGVAYRYDCTRWLGHWTILMVAPVVVAFYLPRFRAAGVRSAYDLLEQRFGVALRWFGSVAFVAFHLGRIGIVLYLPALALQAVTGIDVYLATALIGGLATLYTVLGGIEAVIWTDVLQAIVLLVGASACMVVAVSGAGGVEGWWASADAAGRLDLLDWRWDPTATVVWVVVLGNLTASLTTYTTDQTVVQRYLAARSDAGAVRAVLLNAVMMVAVGGLFFMLGTALFGFYAAHPEALAPGRSDAVLPEFVATQLPAVFRAIVLAALLAAAMSSLDSSINGIASTVVHDWFERLRPGQPPARALRVGRVVSVVVGVVGVVFALWIAAAEVAAMFDWFNMLLGLVGSGLAAAFALAVFSRKATGAGVLLGVVIALVVTLWVRASTPLHLYLYGAIGFSTCVAVALVASRWLPGPAGLSTRTP